MLCTLPAGPQLDPPARYEFAAGASRRMHLVEIADVAAAVLPAKVRAFVRRSVAMLSVPPACLLPFVLDQFSMSLFRARWLLVRTALVGQLQSLSEDGKAQPAALEEAVLAPLHAHTRGPLHAAPPLRSGERAVDRLPAGPRSLSPP